MLYQKVNNNFIALLQNYTKKIKMKTTITRREALLNITALGGSVPLVQTMGVLGLMNVSSSAHAKPASISIDPTLGRGKTVAIIGAGLSGLTAAYELSNLGFTCKIFEAAHRPKGRTFTVRPDGSRDSMYQETGGNPETCSFDEVDGQGSLYFEAGAGRIPSHHRTVLNYCKQFNVPLESYIFASRANLVYSKTFNGGKPVTIQQFKHNLRGYLAEMCRTVDPEKLNRKLTPKEAKLMEENFNDLRKSFGQLNDDLIYSFDDDISRAGYKIPPGAGIEAGQFREPLNREAVLAATDIWGEQLFNDMRHYWQTSLLQPVGGIDKIAEAFMRQPATNELRIGNLIQLSRQVVQISLTEIDNKVVVYHQNVDALGKKLSSDIGRFEADYCISTIAPSLLHKDKIKNDFDVVNDKFNNALINGVSNVAACKVAWQAERFWENDENQIYGGISWTSDIISQIWYPSTGFHNQRGILTGAYVRGETAKEFGELSRKGRVKQALIQGRRLHRELVDPRINHINKAMTIAWQNMPFQAGGWVEYTDEQRNDENGYKLMLKGLNDRFFMAGDAMGYNEGWMEGAIEAGLSAKDQISAAVEVSKS
ncbi:MAG: FAD-dependent oxidoreductase [Pseudomonadota bacterium]